MRDIYEDVKITFYTIMQLQTMKKIPFCTFNAPFQFY